MSQFNLYQYRDLKSLLSGFVEYKRSINPRWSLGVWSRQLNLSSSAVLTNYTKGRKVPAKEVVTNLITSITQDPQESIFLNLLIEKEKKMHSKELVDIIKKELSKYRKDFDKKKLREDVIINETIQLEPDDLNNIKKYVEEFRDNIVKAHQASKSTVAYQFRIDISKEE